MTHPSINCLADVHLAIAMLINPEHKTQEAITKSLGFLRVCTHDADTSILFLGQLVQVPGMFYFFQMVSQPESLDSGVGSTFIIGGDATFLRNSRFLQTGGLSVNIQIDPPVIDTNISMG